MTIDFSQRHTGPEKMDDLFCDQKKLINTIRQFDFINLLLSRSRSLIKKYFIPYMEQNTRQAYRFLDIGAGGCDIPLWLSRYCRKKNINMHITCLDHDPRMIEFARERIKEVTEIELVEGSIFDYVNQQFDFIFSNHFMHHLPDKTLFKFISMLDSMTRINFLMNDLKRSRISYLAYKLFAGLFLHNSYASYDGGISILRGFKASELEQWIDGAKCKGRIMLNEVLIGRIFLTRHPEHLQYLTKIKEDLHEDKKLRT